MTKQTQNDLSDRLLDTIRRTNKKQSLANLNRRLKASKADILFAIDLLKSAGYEIETDGVRSCQFKSAPDLLLAAELKYGLKTRYIGQTIYS